LFLDLLGSAASTILLSLTCSVAEVVIVSMTGSLLSAAVELVAPALAFDQLPEDRGAGSFSRFNQIGGWSFVGGLGLGMA
jgi:hypothetical protein